MKMYRCLVCGEIFPMNIKICPTCGVAEENFEVIEVPDIVDSKNDFKALIIGGGIAGVTTAIELRRRNSNAKITIISEENSLPYNRTLLTKEFNINLNDIDLKSKAFYEENNIELVLGTKVTKINREEKSVDTNKDESISYDYLVLANGSSSIILDYGDFKKENVFGLRSKEDAFKLKEALGSRKNNITIVGGGALGLELAQELALNNKVSIIEKVPYLMFNNFEKKDSLNLKELLNDNGVAVYENTSIIKYNENSVILEDETLIDTDILIYSIGVRSNVALAKEAGLSTNRGVLVDDYLKTNDSSIYACGDVAEFSGRVVALWSNSLDMATCVAKNISGEEESFNRNAYPLVFKLFGNSYYKIGELTDDAVIEAKANSQIKYYFKDEELVGALAINSEAKQGEIYRDVLNHTLKMEY